MSALGELIQGCARRGWKVGLSADHVCFDGELELRAVEVWDRDRDLLAEAHVVADDIEAAAVRAAMQLDAKGLLT